MKTNLINEIKKKNLKARKEKNTDVAGAYQLILTELLAGQKDKELIGKEFTDTDVYKIIQKSIQKTEKNIIKTKKINNDFDATDLELYIKVCSELLPEDMLEVKLSEEEFFKIFDESNIQDANNSRKPGDIMKLIMSGKLTLKGIDVKQINRAELMKNLTKYINS